MMAYVSIDLYVWVCSILLTPATPQLLVDQYIQERETIILLNLYWVLNVGMECCNDMDACDYCNKQQKK